jgi:hypothetical protein
MNRRKFVKNAGALVALKDINLEKFVLILILNGKSLFALSELKGAT